MNHGFRVLGEPRGLNVSTMVLSCVELSSSCVAVVVGVFGLPLLESLHVF